ncbi:28S ribosomal protein S33, mitochondrial [Trichuris trichiura]|uniref:Small ribosomal subunit protein mS33 n=1 Tax=Trichuris trichiura TaxID=36087 RepID=A0A077ZAC2_TRITR|nr:28S ribosomal protein S33, mitochondrial [Trichuris trichiura]
MSSGKLGSVASMYQRKIDLLSKKIFNQLPTKLTTRNDKVVYWFRRMRFSENDYRINYYPPHPMFHALTQMLRFHGLYRDEHQDFMDEFKRIDILRGKGPPKPGEGKRAKLRKKE